MFASTICSGGLFNGPLLLMLYVHRERSRMAERIPKEITRVHILAAIDDLKKGVPHAFGRSVFYEVLYREERYPPKAVIG
jgi:hypothetical protein